MLKYKILEYYSYKRNLIHIAIYILLNVNKKSGYAKENTKR